VPTTHPAGPFTAVARGGSFYDDPTSLRSANRCAIPADTREFTVGFRVLCEDDQARDIAH
jgi:formylglycine-generating enzyme required for sulfatase activity